MSTSHPARPESAAPHPWRAAALALCLSAAVLPAPHAAGMRRFRKPAPEEAGGVATARLARDSVRLGRSVRLFVDLPGFCRGRPGAVALRIPPALAGVRRGSMFRLPDGDSMRQVFVVTPLRPGPLDIPSLPVRCGRWRTRTFRLVLNVLPPPRGTRPGAAPAGPWTGAIPAAPAADDARVAALKARVADLQQTVDRLQSQPDPGATTVPLLRGAPAERPASAAPPLAPLPAPAPLPPPNRAATPALLALIAAGLALLTAGLWRLVARPVPAAPAAGTIAGGRYTLGRVLGEGGMGVVYEAHDQALGRTVAVKRMRPELKTMPRERQRFLDEARAVAKITHPYIVGLHEVVAEGDEVYIVFDLVRGRTLSDVLAERGRLPLAECRAIMTQVCQALDCAHRCGVLHRDLKPSNIMVDADGLAKVMDFGIAREAKDAITRLTRTQTIVGTPTHMAPEQHLGRAGRSTDVYAIGVCLYEMLTGAVPFNGPDFLAQKERRLYTPPSRLVPGLPREADVLIAAALEPDPGKRIADPLELLAGLKQLVG